MDIGHTSNIHPSCLCLNCFPHSKHAKHFKAKSSIGYRTNAITENKPPQIHIKTSPVGVPAGEVHSYEKNGYKLHTVFYTNNQKLYSQSDQFLMSTTKNAARQDNAHVHIVIATW